jgi:catechol 2,3-dioxygenase-like lactoylglutathione lyase family enzyme
MADEVRFDQLNIVVDDMEASVAFYRRLGFEVPDTMPEWQGHHRNLTTPQGLDVDLDSSAFAQQWGNVSRGTVLNVHVPTRAAVDELVAALAAEGHEVVKEPWDAFWGARYAVVRDPSGNPIGLMSESSDEHRGAPPAPPG